MKKLTEVFTEKPVETQSIYEQLISSLVIEVNGKSTPWSNDINIKVSESFVEAIDNLVKEKQLQILKEMKEIVYRGDVSKIDEKIDNLKWKS